MVANRDPVLCVLAQRIVRARPVSQDHVFVASQNPSHLNPIGRQLPASFPLQNDDSKEARPFCRACSVFFASHQRTASAANWLARARALIPICGSPQHGRLQLNSIPCMVWFWGRGHRTSLRDLSGLSAPRPAGHVFDCPLVSAMSVHRFLSPTRPSQTSTNPFFSRLSRSRLHCFCRGLF
jgi:hypothetical protein